MISTPQIRGRAEVRRGANFGFVGKPIPTFLEVGGIHCSYFVISDSFLITHRHTLRKNAIFVGFSNSRDTSKCFTPNQTS